MGRSRSATLILAYLLSTDRTLYPESALSLLRQVRPLADPNSGFVTQLELYHRLGCPKDLDAHPEYQRWCWDRSVANARERREAPDLTGMTLRDEGGLLGGPAAEGLDGGGSGMKQEEDVEREFRCRRCRTYLSSSACLLSTHGKKTQSQGKSCSHHWLEQPLSWMRGEMEEGKLDGRLECPNTKCKTLVGRYSWQGLRCSCGEWVVPGISLAVGKVDEVKVKRAQGLRADGGDGVKSAEDEAAEGLLKEDERR